MSDIFLMKGVKEFIERILKAVETKEKIIFFADADLDGVASAIILKEALELLGSFPLVYFSNREKEGYGLSSKFLKFLKKEAPAILITLDCGIGNFREIKMAKNLGFEPIIIDHHEILERLPEAKIIINPKQEDDEYPFKELSTAGIVYNLAKTLLFEAKKTFEPERFLELAMIATIFDRVSLKNQNQKILKEGILALSFTKRVGLKALMGVSGFEDFNPDEVREKIIFPLVSANSKRYQAESYLLLTENSYERAKKIAKNLLKKQKLKGKRINEILEELKTRIDPSLPIIFEGDENWPLTFTGSLATRIYQKYKKPVFIFKKGKKESQGSVRTPKEINSVKLMAKCSHFLKTYGGHPQASGFRLKNENLPKFYQCLLDQFKNPMN